MMFLNEWLQWSLIISTLVLVCIVYFRTNRPTLTAPIAADPLTSTGTRYNPNAIVHPKTRSPT